MEGPGEEKTRKVPALRPPSMQRTLTGECVLSSSNAHCVTGPFRLSDHASAAQRTVAAADAAALRFNALN